jgi:uncharacterized protein DUF4390
MRISCAALVIVLLAARVAVADVRATPTVREGRVWVTFGLPDGYTPQLRQAVLSGLPVTFIYDIELRRGVPFWPDRTLNGITVAVTVTYDSLTRHHSLARTFDGRIDATRMSKDEAEVERWLTGPGSMPLFPTALLEARGEYYIRVRARTRPHHSTIVWPWDRGLVTNANFTFNP